MLYTFSQFQRTKKSIIQQFNQKPAIDVHCFEWDQGFNEYRKILNDLKASKHTKKRNCQSATRIRVKSKVSRPQTQRFNKKFQNISQDAKIDFYLTELVEDDSKLKTIDWTSLQNNNEHDQLLSIIIRLSQCGQIHKNLKEQVRELENSIRCFRKSNHELEWKLKQGEKKENTMFNLLLRKKNDLINFQNKNKEFKEKLNNTQRFFGRSLRSIQNNVKKNQQKTSEMTEDVVEALLTKQKLKQKNHKFKIEEELLNDKIKKKEIKIKQMKRLFERAQSLIYTQQTSMFIRKNGYGHLEELKEFNENRSNRKQYTSNKIVQKIEETNIMKISREMLKVYKKMKADEEKLKQMYEFKIIERREREQELDNLKLLTGKYSLIDDDIHFNSGFMNIDEQRQIQLLKQTENKVKRLCDMVQSMQQRGQFFIKKQIKFLILIIENWLQYDESSISFVNQIIETFSRTFLNSRTNCSFEDSKKQLIGHFQNWQNYSFFIEDIFRNPLMYKDLTKKKFRSLLKRIIKTKIHTQHDTQELFFCCYQQIFQSNITNIYEDITTILNSFKQIYFHASKYQVLVVNMREPSVEFFPCTKVKSKLIYPMNKRQERLLEMQELQEQRKKVKEQDEQEKENEQKQVGECPPELVQYILEYQAQINKVSSLNKKNKKNTNLNPPNILPEKLIKINKQ